MDESIPEPGSVFTAPVLVLVSESKTAADASEAKPRETAKEKRKRKIIEIKDQPLGRVCLGLIAFGILIEPLLAHGRENRCCGGHARS